MSDNPNSFGQSTENDPKDDANRQLPEGPEVLREQPYSPVESMRRSDSPSGRPRNRYWLHLLLFLLTALTTTLAGAELRTNKVWLRYLGPPDRWLQLEDLYYGLPFMAAFLAFITTHEFGHYFAARWRGVRTSLPYFIPVFIPGLPSPVGWQQVLNIGSFGAVIRLRQQPRSTTEYFDIGIAGPLAGFVVSVAVLFVGFTTLPPLQEYLLLPNPDYLDRFGGVPTLEQLLAEYGAVLRVGDSLILMAFEAWVADPERLPNHAELIHYPLLFAGFLTLFFTALNLLPIGQLDGGHVTYALFGRRVSALISRVVVSLLLVWGGLGWFQWGQPPSLVSVLLYIFLLYLTTPRIVQSPQDSTLRLAAKALLLSAAILAVQLGVQELFPRQWGVNPIWLLYAVLAVRVIRLDHPPALREERLDRKRQVLGWLALVIFVLCFSPAPVELVFADPNPASMVSR